MRVLLTRCNVLNDVVSVNGAVISPYSPSAKFPGRFWCVRDFSVHLASRRLRAERRTGLADPPRTCRAPDCGTDCGTATPRAFEMAVFCGFSRKFDRYRIRHTAVIALISRAFASFRACEATRRGAIACPRACKAWLQACDATRRASIAPDQSLNSSSVGFPLDFWRLSAITCAGTFTCSRRGRVCSGFGNMAALARAAFLARTLAMQD